MQSRDVQSRDEQSREVQSRDEKRKRDRGAERETGRVPCNEREMREPEFAEEARSFIGSAQHN